VANIAASVEAAHRIIAPQEHRVVSLLPLSHLLEQVTADDKRFLMLREGDTSQESELIVALHWLDGLKGKSAR